jgi:hypothetical protein
MRLKKRAPDQLCILNRLANQTDRYVEVLKNSGNEKSGRVVGGLFVVLIIFQDGLLAASL